MENIRFDDTCMAWTKRDLVNRTYLEHNINYLKEKLAHRGYLYLNEVYDAIGRAWNPDKENVCYRETSEFIVEVEPAGDLCYQIKIH